MILAYCILFAYALIGAYAAGGYISECVRRYMRDKTFKEAVKAEMKRFCRREALRRKGKKLIHNAGVWSDELKTLFR